MQIDFITPVKVSAGIENTSRSWKGNNSALGGGSTAAFIGGSTQTMVFLGLKVVLTLYGYNQYFSTIDDDSKR
jgi:hypothetical protein